MKFLIDTSPASMASLIERPLVLGQLLTPLTRYANFGGTYAIDNGAFSGFPADAFQALLVRETKRKQSCLFVTCPDIVGNGRRTLEIWRHRNRFIRYWPTALVAQDGMEDMDIPWSDLEAIFVGGKDPWKDSQAAIDICKTARTLGKHVHIGRVNTTKRYRRFMEVADTCDGSGIARFEHMLPAIERDLELENHPTLFDGVEHSDCA